MAKTTEERLALLESIIKQDSITLTSETNPCEQIVLEFKTGTFRAVKRKTIVAETDLKLINIKLES